MLYKVPYKEKLQRTKFLKVSSQSLFHPLQNRQKTGLPQASTQNNTLALPNTGSGSASLSTVGSAKTSLKFIETRADKFERLLESLQGKPESEQVKKVNRFFNLAIKYKTDPKNHWQGQAETLNKGHGDCEDFAIAKYEALRTLGIPEERLHITFANYRPHPKQRAQGHIFLIYDSPQNKALILDNINKGLKSPAERKDLSPVYSFNRQGLWKADKNSSNWQGELAQSEPPRKFQKLI